MDAMDTALAHRAQATFALLGPAVFPIHGPWNSRLEVEVVDTGSGGDAPTFIVVLPWGLEGLIFTPDDRFPPSIALGGRRHRVFHHELRGLGHFLTVELVENVTPLASSRHARKVACLIGPSFRDAVARARQELFAA